MNNNDENKFLSVTFNVKMATHISMEEGKTLEEKLENWVKHAENALTDDIRHWGELDYKIDLVESKVVEYD